MNAYELSYLADTLLTLVERDPLAPHYSEETFRRKLDQARRRESKLPLTGQQSSASILFHDEWKEIQLRARLTQRQAEVFELRLSGWTFEEIGGARGHSKQGAKNIFSQGVKKILRSQDVYPYSGLSEVYRQEVQRGHL